MILIIGNFTVDPARRAEALEAMRPLVEASRAEDGCVDYSFLADPYDDGNVRVVERWVDEAALRAHFEMPHFAQAGELLRRFDVQRGEIVKYRTDWEGGVGDAPS